MTCYFIKMAVSVAVLLAFAAANVAIADGKAVKIVEEPAVYRGVNMYLQQREQHKIVARVKEKPFTGANYFKALDGKCFSMQQNGYKYELCPFHNVTQKEDSPRWNAFSGVLGVWKEWIIVNNTFHAMLMDEGDLCGGNTPRETKVFLKCAEENKLRSVKEPHICKYELVLATPLACPLDSLLVFPALSEEEQMEWLDIEKAMYHQELTPQGYNKWRWKLFEKAGFLPKADITKEEEEKKPMLKSKGDTGSRENPPEEGKASTEFSSVDQCAEAYRKLEIEVMKLRELLNNTNNGSCDNAAWREILHKGGAHGTSPVPLKTLHRTALKNESAAQGNESTSLPLKTVQIPEKSSFPSTVPEQTGTPGTTEELHASQQKSRTSL